MLMDYLKDGFARFDVRNGRKMNLDQKKKNVQRGLDFVVNFVVVYILVIHLQEDVVSETLDPNEGSSDYSMEFSEYSLVTKDKPRLRHHVFRANFEDRGGENDEKK